MRRGSRHPSLCVTQRPPTSPDHPQLSHLADSAPFPSLCSPRPPRLGGLRMSDLSRDNKPENVTKGMTERKTWRFELDISGGSIKSRLISQFPLQPTKDGGLGSHGRSRCDQGVKSINPTAACCRRLGVRLLPEHCGVVFFSRWRMPL